MKHTSHPIIRKGTLIDRKPGCNARRGMAGATDSSTQSTE